MASKTEAAHVNMTFVCLTYSLLGWLLILLANIRAGGRPLRLLFPTIIAALLCGMALRRRRALWDGVYIHRPGLGFLNLAALGRHSIGLLVLALAGISLGFFATRSFAVLAVCAGLLGLAPWSKLTVCREHYIPCNLLLTACACVTICWSWANPVSLVIAAWMLWGYAACYEMMTLGKSRIAGAESACTISRAV